MLGDWSKINVSKSVICWLLSRKANTNVLDGSSLFDKNSVYKLKMIKKKWDSRVYYKFSNVISDSDQVTMSYNIHMEIQDIDSMNALVPLGRCLKMLRYVKVFVDYL